MALLRFLLHSEYGFIDVVGLYMDLYRLTIGSGFFFDIGDVSTWGLQYCRGPYIASGLLALGGLSTAACRPGACPAVLLNVGALHGVLQGRRHEQQ